MLRLPSRIAQAIASLGLTTSTAARKIGGDMAGYKAAYKRLKRLTGPNPPETIALHYSPLSLENPLFRGVIDLNTLED
jgi:hypothetical protein